jgi:multiple sugar transport system permease protein
VRRILFPLGLAFFVVFSLAPFAWMVISSFMYKSRLLTDPFALPPQFTLDNYVHLFTSPNEGVGAANFIHAIINSLGVCAITTVISLIVGSIGGYAFARLRFPGREVLFLIVLGTLMIPDQLRLVPVYLMMNAVGLTRGSAQYVAVILVLAIAGTSIFFLRQYFLSIPRDLEEAARIDGAGFFTTFVRVMLPLAGPALAAVAILQFQGTWNGFFWPVIFLQDPDHYTVQQGLYFFRQAGGFSSNWPPLMATVVMATIPVLVLYVFFQRFFVEGIAASGVKG